MKQAKFIAEAANMTVAGWEKPVYLSTPTESVFEDVEVAPLLRSLLTEYLEERGIPYAIAARHCCRLNYGCLLYTSHGEQPFTALQGGVDRLGRHAVGGLCHRS